MNTQSKLIEKLKELVNFYENEPDREKRPNAWDTWADRIDKAYEQISALEKEIAEQPRKDKKQCSCDPNIIGSYAGCSIHDPNL